MARLERDYFGRRPDLDDPNQLVSFDTTTELTAEFGTPCYTRIDAPPSPEQKARLQKLSPDAVRESGLAGEPITAKLTIAPGDS